MGQGRAVVKTVSRMRQLPGDCGDAVAAARSDAYICTASQGAIP